MHQHREGKGIQVLTTNAWIPFPRIDCNAADVRRG